MEEFKNRQSQYINRRKLTIISQTPNELIVDIARNDGVISEAGSGINASVMNDFNSQVNTAVSNAAIALEKANSAITISNEAKTSAEGAVNTSNTANETSSRAETNSANAVNTANLANVTSGEAKTISTEAKTIANEAKTTANNIGTRVTSLENTKCTIELNNEIVTSLAFTSSPQAQLDNKADLTNFNNEVSARQALETLVNTKANQADLSTEITNRQNADSAINAKFNNFASGVVVLNNAETSVTISTGLSAVSTIIPTLNISNSSTISRLITIDTIENGNVVLNIRNATTGALEGISNATELGAKIYWFAMKSFE